MFNSKAFCVITFLTVIALGGAVGLQVMEMQEYNLLDKLYNKYIGSMAAKANSETKAEAETKADAETKTDSAEKKKDEKSEKKKDTKK
jgi:ribosomal protein L12E/L44/L45/RPP1/RPP2